jgi:hypothetical protein
LNDGPTAQDSRAALWSPALACLVTLGAAARFFFLTDRYAVNLLFTDQWGFYKPLFYGYDAWHSFTLQYGPHRMGVGMFVTEAVAFATGWNTRAEAFVVGFIFCLAAVAALCLKWRLFGSLTAWDSIIPLIVLSISQVSANVVVAFPSYSAVPVLLLMLYALGLTCRGAGLRYGAVSVLNFTLVFTGWGFFAGLLTPPLLAYLLLRHAAARERAAKRWAGVALAASLLSLALFFFDYRFQPAVDCFHFPHYPPGDYFLFVAHMFSYSVGVGCTYPRVAEAIGTLLILVFLFALAVELRRLARARAYEPEQIVVVFFIGFSLVFALNAAVGRVCLGICAAVTDRYTALLVPAWLGLYFVAAGLGSRSRRNSAWLLIFTLCFLVPQLKESNYERDMGRYAEAKKEWVACYLEKEDAALCDEGAGKSIYAAGRAGELKERLDYLKRRRLNFFAGQ